MNTQKWCGILWVGVVMLVCSTFVSAQTYRNMSSVHDGSGRMSTNTVNIGGVDYYHVSAAGQPGGIATSTNGTIQNYGGFLQAVDIKRPNLDTDGNGVINEISQDNDGDGIHDLAEIEGTGFDPGTATEVNIADTDGDGVTDGHEAIAGTDPTNENAYLSIVSIDADDGGGKIVEWTARGDGNQQYRVLAATDGDYSEPTNVLTTTTVGGGVAPWYEVTTAFTNTPATSNRFYAIETLQ